MVDRLEKKGLIRHEVPAENRRSVIVSLTSEGETLFQQVFPAHVADIHQHLATMDTSEIELVRVLLKRLQQAF